ncbi:MAG: dihydropteroate synthase, partial [Thermoleophilia bacterium]
MKPHPYIISIGSQAGAARLQEQIGVAGEGIEIMAPLSVARLVRVGGLNARIANVLKQEMLAAGGDAALPVD